MSVILGIDIGGSTTKIVGLRPDGSHIAMHRVQAQDPITSLYGALGNFLFTNGLQLSDVDRIALTGVGASYVDGDIYGIPTEKVDEFAAVGTGGLALSGQEKAVVISMGTGTAFIWAERGGEIRHLCGLRRGGRHPGRPVLQALRHPEVRPDRQAGRRRGHQQHRPDGGGHHPQQPPLPAPGHHRRQLRQRLRQRHRRGFRRRAINMVLQSIGTTAVMACRACGCETVVATGFMSTLPQAPECFALFTRLHGVHFIIPENATFATSIGAALCSGKE